MIDEPANPPKLVRAVAIQGWIGLAAWMTFGLILEGLLGFRSPAYLQEPLRRELFQLAHVHGTMFSILLLVACLYLRNGMTAVPNLATLGLRAGSVLMPLGFLLGGIWHYGNDPGPAVFLAPAGGLIIIFGVVAFAISSLRPQGTAEAAEAELKEPEEK